ncbi:hypothetical protein FRC04_004798 [Tulasnella sp. 424]|nr:hypothetical protein FRC04_004798 [Tulasnella sp. 424]
MEDIYRYYDTLTEEIDVDMVKSLKAQLDGICAAEAIFSTSSFHGFDEASTVDVCLFLNFLRIRDLLPSPAFYALLEGITENQRQFEYESAYDELVICFARLESAVLAVQRAARPVMADPADPPPIQVVDGEDGIGENSADGKNQPDWKPPATSPYDDGSGESMDQVL